VNGPAGTLAIVLIGPRASGKTSLGQALARRLRRRFIDLDALVLEHLGAATVTEAWRRGGESAWRAAEAAVLEKALEHPEGVVALGGGTPMIPAGRRRLERLRREGRIRVVYLECPVAELTGRLRGEPGDRPSLTGADPAAEIEAVLADREATYRALADVVFAAWGQPQDALAARLAEALET
jgi:shikimate kinase